MRKNIVICGQSNERGKAIDPDDNGLPRIARRGCPVADPMTPNGTVDGTPTTSYYGSAWPKLAEKLYDRSSDWINIYNCCKGSTGFTIDWCGDSVGDGTGTVYTSADGGWDPSSYLSTALTYAQAGDGFDERWAFIIETGQNDATNTVSAANVQAALENITNYFLDNNIKVAIGCTCYQDGQDAYFTNNIQPSIEAALNTFASDSNVIAGGNMWTRMGARVGLVEGTHMNNSSFEIMTEEWYDKLLAAEW